MPHWRKWTLFYDWIYENGVNNLRKMTHTNFDFTTPKGSLQAMRKRKNSEIKGEQQKQDKRGEEKERLFINPDIFTSPYNVTYN